MLLAVDTSTRVIGVALITAFEVISEVMWESDRFHTVELAAAVRENLDRAKTEPSDLTGLGLAVGPGSFTGLRIGMALIKGIAYAQNLPIYGIPTLDVTAQSHPVTEEGNLVAVLKAGRNRLAAGWYRAQGETWVSEGRLQNLSPEELISTIDRPTLFTGELSGEIRERLTRSEQISAAAPALAVRRPAVLAQLAWKRLKDGSPDDPETLSPMYLSSGKA